VKKKGAHTDARLKAMLEKRPAAKLVLRSKGMIHGIDFGDGKPAARASTEAFDRGLIIATCGPGGRVLKVMAPLTIEPNVLDEGLDILDAAIGAALVS
jgi:diaminobutyrate-2-oxoglutarate transaminase